MSGSTRLAPFLAAACLCAPLQSSAVPRLLGYQGRLLRADDTAATGTASVTFAVYAAESGGTTLWSETQTLGLSDGYYSTLLGLVVTPSEGVFDGAARWLEVRIGGETLAPRQHLGAVAYAFTAQAVAGGAADVSSLMIAGQTVVGADGRLAGTARYSAGTGVSVEDATQTISLQACSAGQVLANDGTLWRCTDRNAGMVTQVTAGAPLSVVDGNSTPSISMSRAGTSSAGYLSSSDWNAFDAKYGALTQSGGDLSGTLAAPVVARLQSRPMSAVSPLPGQVIKWSAVLSQWEPASDLNSGGTVTSVVAVAPLTAQNGTTNAELSIAQASASVDGYLGSADFARFEAKYGSATQCGGDLEGALASPVVARLQGVAVSTVAPAAAQVLRFDGSRWAPAALGIADVGGLSSGYLDLSGNQTVAGVKSFQTAPVFSTPLGVASGGIGVTDAGANAVFAGPSGSSGAPAFRALVPADLPAHDASKINSGTLPVAYGGTGVSSLAANQLLLGNGTGAVSTLGGGASGQYLAWNGTSAPAWQTPTVAHDSTLTGNGAGVPLGVSGSAITSLGVIGSGTWQGNAIADAYIASASAWNGKLATVSRDATLTGNGAGTALGVAYGTSSGTALEGSRYSEITGLATRVTTLESTVASLQSALGSIAQLHTADKTSVVAAVNTLADQVLIPKVQSLNTTSACRGISVPLTITGKNLSGASQVSLSDGTVLTGTLSGTDTQITGVSVPATAAPGTHDVRVTTLFGTNITSEVQFTVLGSALGDTTISSNATFSEPRGVLNADAAAGATTINAGGSGWAQCDRAILISHYATNPGRYEIVTIWSVSGTTLTLASPLAYAYSAGARTQVARILAVRNLTVNSGVTWSAPAWDGSTGGILAVEASGTVTISGSIASGAKGYRGGPRYQSGSDYGLFA